MEERMENIDERPTEKLVLHFTLNLNFLQNRIIDKI